VETGLARLLADSFVFDAFERPKSLRRTLLRGQVAMYTQFGAEEGRRTVVVRHAGRFPINPLPRMDVECEAQLGDEGGKCLDVVRQLALKYNREFALRFSPFSRSYSIVLRGSVPDPSFAEFVREVDSTLTQMYS